MARVPLDSTDGRTLGPTDGLASIPLPNHRNSPQRKCAASLHWRQPHVRLRLGCGKGLGQSPAKRRGFRRWIAPVPTSLCNSRLVGGAGSPARTRLSSPNSLIYGKIQGIRADSGSAGLAVGPDSLASTRTYAPLSLEPGTGNFVPRSREFAWPRSTESRGHDLPRKVLDGGGRPEPATYLSRPALGIRLHPRNPAAATRTASRTVPQASDAPDHAQQHQSQRQDPPVLAPKAREHRHDSLLSDFHPMLLSVRTRIGERGIHRSKNSGAYRAPFSEGLRSQRSAPSSVV